MTARIDHLPGGADLAPGFGRVGAVVLSHWIAPNSLNDTPYNHYGLLRTIEDLFGLDHLGYAADPALAAFDTVVYNAKPATD